MAGRKQKPTKDVIMMTPGLRAQVPNSPSLSIASGSSRRPLQYANAGYENTQCAGSEPDYEDLEYYNRATGPRKQPNVIYESAPSTIPPHVKTNRHRQFTECSDDSTSTGSLDHYHTSSKKSSRCKDGIFGLIVLISFTSLVLVLLMAFGVFGPKCSTCESKKGMDIIYYY